MCSLSVGMSQQRPGSISSRATSGLDDAQLWLIAVLFFGVGDVVTTSLGLWLPGVTETHPVAAYFFQHSVLGGMVVLKGIALGSCYLLWRLTPHPHCVGVPLGLVVLGVVITVWNAHILLRASI